MFDRFSSVTFGYTLAFPGLHLVTLHQFRAMKMAVRRLRALGYRRPGERRPGDAPAQLHPCDRLMVNLEGRVARKIMRGGRRETLVMGPGGGIVCFYRGWRGVSRI
jgi:hypothetical protein